MRKNTSYFCLSVVFTAIFLTLLLVHYSCKQKEKSYVIGYINPNPQEDEGAQGFLRNMPKFGFIEGKNVTYIKFENRDIKGMEDALRDMAAKRVDLIFTITTPAARLAKQITEGTNIPVIVVLYDPVRSEAVKSITDPKGNITGVQLRGSTQKSLEFLRAIAPGVKNIYVPVKFDTGGAFHSLEDLKQDAAKFNIKITAYEINTVEDLRASLSSMPKETDAVFLLHSWLVASNVHMVIDAAIKRKVPVISAGHVDARKGVVLSYAPMDDRTGEQAARLAYSILHTGTRPADLPVETSDFFLGISMKTAQAMGLEIPSDILQQADFIIRE